MLFSFVHITHVTAPCRAAAKLPTMYIIAVTSRRPPEVGLTASTFKAFTCHSSERNKFVLDNHVLVPQSNSLARRANNLHPSPPYNYLHPQETWPTILSRPSLSLHLHCPPRHRRRPRSCKPEPHIHSRRDRQLNRSFTTSARDCRVHRRGAILSSEYTPAEKCAQDRCCH